MLAMLVAGAKILAVKAGTAFDPTHLPCILACFFMLDTSYLIFSYSTFFAN
jgi:hypothetical protein